MIQPLSIVDLLAILPFFRTFRLLRVLRVLRLLKLFRYSHRLSFFTSILEEQSYELVSLVIVGAVMWGVVALAFFAVERHANPDIETLWHAIYWAIITITTVGYGDITPVTPMGQVIAVLGTMTGMWVVVFMTSIIVSALTERIFNLREYRMERQIERMSDHFIVCGLDSLGRAVCRTLEAEHKPFVAIDSVPENVAIGLRERWKVLRGDVTEEETWERLGLQRARCVISSIVDESINVYIILIVKEQRPDCDIVACGGTRRSEKRLRRVGANRVIAPFEIGGTQMAYTAIRPTAVRFVDLALRREHNELEMEELLIPENSRFDNIQLKDSDIRYGFDIIVVGILHPEETKIHFNPGAATILHSGDLLICLGQADDMLRLRKALLTKK
jgi:voltage-gated potassium channel